MQKVNRILLIDDDDEDNEVHTTFIHRTHLCDNVISVTSGKEALLYLEKCLQHEIPFPEIVFLDMMMRDMTAYELLDEYAVLLKKYKTKPKIKIFILAGFLQFEEKEALTSAHKDVLSGFYHKPLTEQILKDAIQSSR